MAKTETLGIARRRFCIQISRVKNCAMRGLMDTRVCLTFIRFEFDYQQQHELAAVVLRFNCPVLNKLRHHFGVSGDAMQKAKKTTNDYKSVKTIVSGENLVFYMI
jgi:hypothetical protein